MWMGSLLMLVVASRLAAPAEAPVDAVPEVAAPVREVPLDTETPEPAGLGLQRRERRRIAAATSLDLDGLWDDYEEDVDEDGERRGFTDYVAQKYRVRRGLGIGVTIFGAALLGTSVMWGYYAATEELEHLPAFFAVLSAVSAGAGIAGIVVGARIWRRNTLRLDELRGAGFLAGGPRWGLRAAGPIALPRGAGLGLSLAF
jgi:hypothetical protein